MFYGNVKPYWTIAGLRDGLHQTGDRPFLEPDVASMSPMLFLGTNFCNRASIRSGNKGSSFIRCHCIYVLFYVQLDLSV